MIKRLKREAKEIVKRHMETMEARDQLAEALERMIDVFCPDGQGWDGTDTKTQAEDAILAAKKDGYKFDADLES